MKRCCAYGCKAKSGPGTRFFNFPACKERSKEWLRALNRLDILADLNEDRRNLLNFYYVCGAHISKRNKDTGIPVLHIVSKGTCTDQNTNTEEKGTSTADLIRNQPSKGTSTSDLMLRKLSRTSIDIIDIQPTAYDGPTQHNVASNRLLNKPAPPMVSSNKPRTGYKAAGDIYKKSAKPVETPQTCPKLRTFRKNTPTLPTIAVPKLQTDIPATSQSPNVQCDNRNISESNKTEIKTEENTLVLDDIVMALSERQRNGQDLESSMDGRKITFKVKMSLPYFSVEEATTSGTIKRELDDDEIEENVNITEKRTKPG
ncbi:uncharacterized protein LOC133528919 [Cydia pomonella]|uniref:uncharacterized protein LOC133528919 n=1 Tax=Cydia pomonella TaxID=82600 RepID=UPI002ADDCA13|nr:uncharacterized protein LOC133528919 [Cydia pomonella]